MEDYQNHTFLHTFYLGKYALERVIQEGAKLGPYKVRFAWGVPETYLPLRKYTCISLLGGDTT